VTEITPTSRGVGRASWRYAARRTFHGFVKHRGLDSAASLTFFATLALFPGSLTIVSIFALATGDAEEAARRITDISRGFLAPATVDVIDGPVHQLLNIPNPGIALTVGLTIGVWSVSSYATAFGRAMNAVYEVQEGRQFWKFRSLMLVLALVLIVGFAVIGTILISTPTISGVFARAVGIPQGWALAWNIAKWPLLAVLLISIVGTLYYFTPNVRHLRIRWVSWGASFAMIAWGLATLGFSLYVQTFDTYNRVYGWLGGAVALLLWLYLTNLVLVLGAEADAEIVRVRQLAAGIAAESVIQLPVRDTKRNLMLARRQHRDETEGREIRERAIAARAAREKS
jgi:membrane protein